MGRSHELTDSSEICRPAQIDRLLRAPPKSVSIRWTQLPTIIEPPQPPLAVASDRCAEEEVCLTVRAGKKGDFEFVDDHERHCCGEDQCTHDSVT
jgi:hypothetical protein